MKITVKDIKTGQKLKFADDKLLWTVRAVEHPYIICTSQPNKNGYHTIINVEKNIRGAGTSWGCGYITDDDVKASMDALHDRHPDDIQNEISFRNRVPLNIAEIKEHVTA